MENIKLLCEMLVEDLDQSGDFESLRFPAHLIAQQILKRVEAACRRQPLCESDITDIDICDDYGNLNAPYISSATVRVEFFRYNGRFVFAYVGRYGFPTMWVR